MVYNVYMILFSDFDRTFYFRSDEEKTQTNFEAVKKWRAAGHQFCIATGRSYKSVIKEFPQIKEICDYYIVDSGSIILSQTGELLSAFYFDPEVVDGIVRFSENTPNQLIPFYYTPYSESLDYQNNSITKIRLWLKDPNVMKEIAGQIKSSFPVFAFALEAVSSYDALKEQRGFIEIIPSNYGKSEAIKYLQKDKNIPSEDIITIGDSLNDYEMIRDFNGFVIEGSDLSNTREEINTTSSVATLIDKLLS